MKLKYYYFNNTVPPCIVLKKLSTQEHEEEVLLFPFTFIYVESLKKINDKYNKLYVKIINKDCVLEFGLKKVNNFLNI